MKRLFSNKEIARVKKRNTHGFRVREKIVIIKRDTAANIAGIDNSVIPIYYAKSVNNTKNRWWIAETEISKINDE